MNPLVLKALMGDMTLKDFIRERGRAIKEVGRSKYSLKTVRLHGHLHTELYPARHKPKEKE